MKEIIVVSIAALVCATGSAVIMLSMVILLVELFYVVNPLVFIIISAAIAYGGFELLIKWLSDGFVGLITFLKN